MKKFLSILLTAILLVVPLAEAVAYAVPSAVDTVDVSAEALPVEEISGEQAELTAAVTYNVTFNANGGTNAPLFQRKTEGRNLVIKSAMPTREGYTFAGWATTADAVEAEYLPGDVYTQDSDITLYAVWTDIYGGTVPIAADYKVVATPHNATNGAYYTYSNGYECLVLEMYNGENPEAPVFITLTPEELGIEEGTSDNYFMNVFSILMVLDEYNEVHSIISAHSKTKMKTVTELELCEVTTNKASSYFSDSDGEAKLLSGEIKAGDESIYVFNAPATYANVTYPEHANEYDKYCIRNSKNILAVEFSKEKIDGQDYYYADTYEISYFPNSDSVEENYFEDQAYELLEYFYNVYYDGLYEADLYDIDGDGLYDYINYKPYTLFRVDADEDEFFEGSDFYGECGIPYIYTNEATVIGEEFNDGDVVLGYFSEDLETVKIAAVIEPTVDYVKSYNKRTGTLTLGSGSVVDAVSFWKILYKDGIIWDEEAYAEELVWHTPLFSVDVLDSNNLFNFYIYNGILLLSDEFYNPVRFTENLIIPTDIKSVKHTFDTASGKDVWYVYAWVDGSTKYVPVEVEDVYPEIIRWDELCGEYIGKLCTYTIDENGIYTIKSLGYAESEDGEYEGMDWDYFEENEDIAQFYGELSETTLSKIAGSRFNLEGLEFTVNLTSDTKIVIRTYNEETDKYSFVEYDAATLKTSLDCVLYNASFVIDNDPTSQAKENLLLLYAETDEDLGVEETPEEPEEKSEITLADITERLVIPTDIKGVRSSFNSATGEDTWYVYAWVDGSLKYIPVDNDSAYPEIIDIDGCLNYENATLCTYTIDENGIYHIRSLGYDESYDGEYTGLTWDAFDDEEDENALFYSEIWNSSIIKVDSSTYSIAGLDVNVNLTDDTKIIVRTYDYNDLTDRGKYSFVEYDKSTIDELLSYNPELYNVRIVVSNNSSSSETEKLVVLYAETDEDLGVEETPEEPEEKSEITLADITERLVIPTDIKGVRSSFNSATGEDTWYVYAWVDGSAKYIPVDNDSVYPEIVDEAWEGLSIEYANKLCTYTIDENGIYHIRSLGYDEDCEGNYTGLPWDEFEDDEDANALLYGELDETTITRIAGTRFNIEGLEKTVDLTDDTRIIIRLWDYEDDSFEYIEFDASTFTNSLESYLYNVSFVLQNNPDSDSRENLVVLYGETDDIFFAGKAEKNGYRIVSNADIGQDANGNWRYFYELYNPYTGDKEYDILSEEYASKPSHLDYPYEAGTIIELVDGQVDEDSKYVVGTIDTANLLWIAEYDAVDGYMAVVPYDATLECKDCVDQYMEDAANDAVTDIYGEEIAVDGNSVNFIDVDKNTVVSVIKYSNLDTIWNWGSMSLTDMSTVADKKTSVLCYNEKATDRYGNYVTRYSDYVKAYVSVDTDVDEDENPVAEYIIVVVNGDENAALGGSFEQDDVVQVTGVTLDKPVLNLVQGEKETLTATTIPSNATTKTVSWKSSDTSVATVQGGVVTAIGEGTATITVTTTDGAKTASCIVQVTKAEPQATVRLSDTVGKAGEKVSVIVSFNTEVLVNTIGITGITYDKNILTFDSFTEYDAIKDIATLKSFDKENMTIVLGFDEARIFDGDLFEFNFIINEDAVDGTSSIDVSSLIKFDHTEITVNNVSGSVTVVSELTGDLDHNEGIDSGDALKLLQYSLFPETYPVEYKGNLDFTKDGYVDIKDAILLLQHSLFPELYPISYN